VRSPRVLVVEDDPEIVKLLSDFLRLDGFSVAAARDSDAALQAFELEPAAVDCIVLDVMLPDGSGFDVCRRVRDRSNVPILFLSARGANEDKLRGLALGADDYIVKSATPTEVVARVKAVLRRSGGRGHNGLQQFGPLGIDRGARTVTLDGTAVALTAREFDLLQLFADHPHQVLTHDQLFERLWGAYGDRSAVSVYIRKLREKLEADPASPERFVSVRGVGYRFDPEPAA
jgi:DNA-binding response OmpR family regulator